jgi:hypothetical protein
MGRQRTGGRVLQPLLGAVPFSDGQRSGDRLCVLHGFSGGWDVHFIELEPPSLPPFNGSGGFTPRLNHAASQLRRWKGFQQQRDKLPYLATQLDRVARKKDLLYKDGREVADSQRRPITDSSSWITFHYYIIMGQRSHLSRDQMRQKAGMKETDGFELITYDRVVDVYEKQLASPQYEHIYGAADPK